MNKQTDEALSSSSLHACPFGLLALVIGDKDNNGSMFSSNLQMLKH